MNPETIQTLLRVRAMEEADPNGEKLPFSHRDLATLESYKEPLLRNFTNLQTENVPITQIIIQNLKGIRDLVGIPIRPLTLLFGANCAGKTTLLHALIYLRERLVRQNSDSDRMVA
jgi:ABC-type Mn2+/Zn2+ transport system ATPase subunit